MNHFSESGVSTTLMSTLAGLNKSTISRYMSQNSLTPLESSSEKRPKYGFDAARQALTEFVSSRHPIDPKRAIQCFYNFKGGTGKTTLCYQYATLLCLCGYKVLLIDADPQGHLTSTLPEEILGEKVYTLYDALIDRIPYSEVIKPVANGLDYIPSDLSLTRIERELNNLGKREEKLKSFLDNIQKKEKYDLVIIDVNPSIGLLNRNVVVASDMINIVTETSPYSLNGLNILVEDLEKFFESMEIDMPIMRIIPNKYEDRSTVSGEVIALLHQYYGNHIFQHFAIRKSEDFVSASKKRAPLPFFCRNNSNAFIDMCDLLKMCIEQMEIEKDTDVIPSKGLKHG